MGNEAEAQITGRSQEEAQIGANTLLAAMVLLDGGPRLSQGETQVTNSLPPSFPRGSFRFSNLLQCSEPQCSWALPSSLGSLSVGPRTLLPPPPIYNPASEDT